VQVLGAVELLQNKLAALHSRAGINKEVEKKSRKAFKIKSPSDLMLVCF